MYPSAVEGKKKQKQQNKRHRTLLLGSAVNRPSTASSIQRPRRPSTPPLSQGGQIFVFLDAVCMKESR